MDNYFSVSLTKDEAKNLSAISLAFVGDAVQALYVRGRLVTAFDCKTDELHKKAVESVKAKSQSEKMEKLIDMFDDDELAIYKRARNTKLRHVAKNASIMEYRRATGFEAVLGYLYLTNDFDRLNEFLNLSFREEDNA